MGRQRPNNRTEPCSGGEARWLGLAQRWHALVPYGSISESEVTVGVKQLCCILTDVCDGRILVRRAGHGWELPRVSIEDPGAADTWNTSAMRGIVKARLGLETYPVYAMEVETTGRPALLAAFELAEDVKVGPPWQWFDPSEVNSHLADAFERSLVEGHTASQQLCVGSGIVPWLRSGWLPAAEIWVREQLGAHGITLTSRPEPVTSRFVGRVLRAETRVGRVYFKAVSQVWCREVETVTELSAWQPQYIPAPLAADPKQGWMLTREVQGPTLTEVTDLNVWEEAVRVYARLQKDSVFSLADGSAKSLFGWRPEALPAGIDRMMEELEWLQVGYGDPLTEDETGGLRQGASEFKDMCLQVAGRGVPAALEHGDLHPGNVRIVDGAPVYLDWAWSSITHPFLSLSLFIPPERVPGQSESARRRLLAAYLEEWQDYGKAPDLEALSRLVHTWSVIQYAVADADWLRSYLRKLPSGPFPANWYLGWIVRMRQYYWIKCLRRMLNLVAR